MAAIGVMHPEVILPKGVVPVVMAGIVGIYGLIVSVILAGELQTGAQKGYSLYAGFAHMSAGLSVGLCGLSSGMSIGISGNAGVRALAQQPKVFVGLVLIMIFAEALALYGLIIALIAGLLTPPACP